MQPSNQKGKPPPMAGGLPEFDIRGNGCRASRRDSREADHRSLHVHDTDSLSHTIWECKHDVVSIRTH